MVREAAELQVDAGGIIIREIALLADVPRTATLTARDDGLLLAIQREAFLVAVTSHELSRTAAWRAIRSLELTAELRESIPSPD